MGGRYLIDITRNDEKFELAARRMEANMAELDLMMFSMDVKLKNKHFPIEKTSFQHDNREFKI